MSSGAHLRAVTAIVDCLDENVVSALVRGELTVAARADADAHLDACADCRELVSEVARSPSIQDQERLPSSVALTRPVAVEQPPDADGDGPRLPAPLGSVVDGKYRLDRVLGAGGMGIVVAATHQQLDQRVALKFMRASTLGSANAVARFIGEARAAVRLASEHVGRVLDLGTLPDGAPFIVMEHLEGADLSAVLKQRKTVPIEEAVGLVLQAIEAVAEAHAAGIIHRDLKPANLFLTRRADGSTCVKVLDFGVSKIARTGDDRVDTMTRARALIGSPLYMAPEQLLSSRDVDVRADIWSLGVILYQLVSGRFPFPPDDMPRLIASILNERPAPLGTSVPVPASFERVVMRCLEKSRDRRYANVFELAVALARFAPAQARGALEAIARPLGLRVSTPSRRRRAVLAGAAAAAVAVAVASWRLSTGDASGPRSGPPGVELHATSAIAPPPMPTPAAPPTAARPQTAAPVVQPEPLAASAGTATHADAAQPPPPARVRPPRRRGARAPSTTPEPSGADVGATLPVDAGRAPADTAPETSDDDILDPVF